MYMIKMKFKRARSGDDMFMAVYIQLQQQTAEISHDTLVKLPES